MNCDGTSVKRLAAKEMLNGWKEVSIVSKISLGIKDLKFKHGIKMYMRTELRKSSPETTIKVMNERIIIMIH